jgi:hypothetical protein
VRSGGGKIRKPQYHLADGDAAFVGMAGFFIVAYDRAEMERTIGRSSTWVIKNKKAAQNRMNHPRSVNKPGTPQKQIPSAVPISLVRLRRLRLETQRAPKRALKVLARVSVCRRLLSIVRLIQSFISVNLLVSAAFREVTAAEWFRRDLG